MKILQKTFRATWTFLFALSFLAINTNLLYAIDCWTSSSCACSMEQIPNSCETICCSGCISTTQSFFDVQPNFLEKHKEKLSQLFISQPSFHYFAQKETSLNKQVLPKVKFKPPSKIYLQNSSFLI